MKDESSAVPQPLFVREFGAGPRRVLALHCTMAHSGAWRGVSAAMPDEAVFVAPDMLSHGRSPDWDGQGDIQDRMTEATAPLLTAGTDLVGHSFGATVALRLAVAQPEKLRSLTLIEPVFFAVALQDAPDLVDAHNAEATPFIEALQRGEDRLAARLFNRMWAIEGQPRWPDLPESTRAAMTRGIRIVPACDASLFRDRAGLLEPGVLSRVRCPVHLIRGSLTNPVIRAVNEGLAQRLADADSLVIEGAGHMAPITHPAETAVLLRRLLALSAG